MGRRNYTLRGMSLLVFVVECRRNKTYRKYDKKKIDSHKYHPTPHYSKVLRVKRKFANNLVVKPLIVFFLSFFLFFPNFCLGRKMKIWVVNLSKRTRHVEFLRWVFFPLIIYYNSLFYLNFIMNLKRKINICSSRTKKNYTS